MFLLLLKLGLPIPFRSAIGFPVYDVRHFMALSISFVSLRKDDNEKCLLCQCSLTKKSKSTTFKDGGWGTLKEQAAQWSVLNLPYDEKLYPFTKVFYIKH